MAMNADDQRDHANWVYAVNQGRTKLGFDDWRAEQFVEEQDALEARAERASALPIQHRIWRHSGQRIR